MNFPTVLFTIAVYLVLFIMLDIATIKKEAPLKVRIMYAVGFFSLITLVNILSLTGIEPPHISVTIFQISFVLILTVAYILYHYFKNKDNS